MDEFFKTHPITAFYQGDCLFVKEALLWAQQAEIELQELRSLEWFQRTVPSVSAGIALLSTQQVDQTVQQLLSQLRQSHSQILPIVMFGDDELELLCSLSLDYQFVAAPKNTRGPHVWNTLAFARARVEESVRNLERDRDFRSALDDLSLEERALLKLWMSGCQNKQLASELDVCLRTAQMRKQAILKKLGEDNLNIVIARIAYLGISEFLDGLLFSK